jgi:hypothetical protein
MRKITHLVIHHSATPSGSVAEFREEHVARGWSDIGYHFLIGNGKGSPEGEIKLGRPESKDGAGVWGNNQAKLHVVLVGNFEKGHSGYTGLPRRKQLGALGHWLLVKGKQYAREGRHPRIVGHREIALPGHGTACPGNQMPLGHIRDWFDASIEQYLGTGKPPQSLDRFLDN